MAPKNSVGINKIPKARFSRYTQLLVQTWLLAVEEICAWIKAVVELMPNSLT